MCWYASGEFIPIPETLPLQRIHGWRMIFLIGHGGRILSTVADVGFVSVPEQFMSHRCGRARRDDVEGLAYVLLCEST